MAAEHTITLLPFEKKFTCASDETILAAALRQGINLRYGCKHGGCGSCKALIVEGEIEQPEASIFALMDFEREQGMALLCSAYPVSDVAIELSDYEESELSAGASIRDYCAEIRAVQRLTCDIVDIRVRLVEPARISFKAGQYMEGQVPGTQEWRAYSMANAPSESQDLEFIIKLFPGGMASSYIEHRLTIGQRIRLSGPYGQFYLREGSRPALFVAGGSGMAPILSILRDMAERRDPRPVQFFYGARGRRDLFYLEELSALEQRLPDFRFIPALSEPAVTDAWGGEVGLITEVLQRLTPDARGMEAYLCGPGAMIDAALDILARLGVSERDVHYDKFVSKGEASR